MRRSVAAKKQWSCNCTHQTTVGVVLQVFSESPLKKAQTKMGFRTLVGLVPCLTTDERRRRGEGGETDGRRRGEGGRGRGREGGGKGGRGGEEVGEGGGERRWGMYQHEASRSTSLALAVHDTAVDRLALAKIKGLLPYLQ